MRGDQPCCASLEYEEMGSGHRMILLRREKTSSKMKKTKRVEIHLKSYYGY
jgi:hypothetical protein